MQTLTCQLSSTLIFVWSRLKTRIYFYGVKHASQTNFFVKFCQTCRLIYKKKCYHKIIRRTECDDEHLATRKMKCVSNSLSLFLIELKGEPKQQKGWNSSEFVLLKTYWLLVHFLLKFATFLSSEFADTLSCSLFCVASCLHQFGFRLSCF